MTSPAVWSPSADSSRLEVQLHWRICRWSWCARREAYECRLSAVFLGGRWWRGSSSQQSSSIDVCSWLCAVRACNAVCFFGACWCCCVCASLSFVRRSVFKFIAVCKSLIFFAFLTAAWHDTAYLCHFITINQSVSHWASSCQLYCKCVSDAVKPIIIIINVKKLNSLKQCLTATRPTSRN